MVPQVTQVGNASLQVAWLKVFCNIVQANVAMGFVFNILYHD